MCSPILFGLLYKLDQRPGCGRNAVRHAHMQVQRCNLNWSRVTDLHFISSDFNTHNRTCSLFGFECILSERGEGKLRNKGREPRTDP